MSIIRCLARMAWTSGAPPDVTVNTFYFNTATPFTDSIGNDITTALTDFYESFTPYWSFLLSGAVETRFYDLADAEPRAPLFIDSFNLTGPASGTAPPEVALCVSFQGVPASGENQGRRRGRVYLGPLNDGAVSSTGRPSLDVLDKAVGAAEGLLAASDAAADWTWVVYSPTKDATLPLASSITSVTNGWVDDEFDTQRRRGREATLRITW